MPLLEVTPPNSWPPYKSSAISFGQALRFSWNYFVDTIHLRTESFSASGCRLNWRQSTCLLRRDPELQSILRMDTYSSTPYHFQSNRAIATFRLGYLQWTRLGARSGCRRSSLKSSSPPSRTFSSHLGRLRFVVRSRWADPSREILLWNRGILRLRTCVSYYRGPFWRWWFGQSRVGGLRATWCL